MGLFKSKQEKRLIALQNFLTPNNSKNLVLTPKQIITSASSYVNARNKVIQNAGKQLNQADNPKKYFEYVDKINIAIEELDRLEKAAPGTLDRKNGNMKDSFEKMLPDGINEMIDRSWKSYQLAASKLTKEDSKKKKLASFFEMMAIYDDKLYPKNRAFISKLKSSVE